jgi:membrane-bound lytic murein transglycosylase MltF
MKSLAGWGWASLLSAWCLLTPEAALSEDDGARDRGVDTELRIFLRDAINTASSFTDRFDAEVWLLDMQGRLKPFMPDDAERLQFLTTLHDEATAAKLSPELVLAVTEVESGFDRFAISRVGAQGYMQVMPFWKQEIGREDDNLTDTMTNLRYGCRILQFYIARENGDLASALAGYNGSSGSTVYSDKVRNAWEKHWKVDNLPW